MVVVDEQAGRRNASLAARREPRLRAKIVSSDQTARLIGCNTTQIRAYINTIVSILLAMISTSGNRAEIIPLEDHQPLTGI